LIEEYQIKPKKIESAAEPFFGTPIKFTTAFKMTIAQPVVTPQEVYIWTRENKQQMNHVYRQLQFAFLDEVPEGALVEIENDINGEVSFAFQVAMKGAMVVFAHHMARGDSFLQAKTLMVRAAYAIWNHEMTKLAGEEEAEDPCAMD
jgi:hypothetical protein